MLKATRELPGRIPLSYRLVSHLAVAEIINIIVKQSTFVSSHLDEWPFGEFACKLAIPFEVLSLFVITNSLAAISLLRFALIVLQYRVTISNRKVILLFSLMWLYALVMVLPLFFYYEYLDKERPWCTSKNRSSNTYQMMRFVANYGLPYLIMVLCYGAVAYKLKRHIKRSEREKEVGMSVLGESTRETGETGVGVGEQDDEGAQQEYLYQHGRTANENRTESPGLVIRLENDLLRMVYMIIVIFAFCYLPYQVNFLLFRFAGVERYDEIVGRYYMIIHHYTLLVMVLPGALHPVCYGTMSAFYARAFSRLVVCRTTSE